MLKVILFPSASYFHFESYSTVDRYILSSISTAYPFLSFIILHHFYFNWIFLFLASIQVNIYSHFNMEAIILPSRSVESTVFLSADHVKSNGKVDSGEIMAVAPEDVAKAVVRALPEEMQPTKVEAITVKPLELQRLNSGEICVSREATKAQPEDDLAVKNLASFTPAVVAPRVSGATKLKKMLDETDELIVCPGVYDGVSARVALSCGFSAMYMVSRS